MWKSDWSAHFNKEPSTGPRILPLLPCPLRVARLAQKRNQIYRTLNISNRFDSCVTVTRRAMLPFVTTCKSAQWSCFSQSRSLTGTFSPGMKNVQSFLKFSFRPVPEHLPPFILRTLKMNLSLNFAHDLNKCPPERTLNQHPSFNDDVEMLMKAQTQILTNPKGKVRTFDVQL